MLETEKGNHNPDEKRLKTGNHNPRTKEAEQRLRNEPYREPQPYQKKRQIKILLEVQTHENQKTFITGGSSSNGSQHCNSGYCGGGCYR